MESDTNTSGRHVKSRPHTTQSAHPWRATLRTAFAVLVGLCSSWGVIVSALGLNPAWQWVAVGTAVAAGVTRILALPQVEYALQTYLPWLAAAPSQ